ncbi:conserved hypothetical protein [Leishmania braziliensis MHOM/BR/75/M2904]|uniref:Uncharacterized protein n=2 Tax=Leishmania braziliensis TaxID=5660 RepID=A4H7J8_LEIBR|nr:conserved hypothetical protein [Leishmania braziliensis MHOM/BR/75/M2904]XP_001563332.1 conserved hypothetical protein [Leishmania braziliensis MHOM/BR/75/M2904]CAJ2469089.1 unnamed protein product [Leishmania braziliensis]CAM37508.1 conserved hypothetical protein [Leishmania braziliensis MHOM/BR/75/M2904]CAM37509.1 conserved hypothetical protein [Leishmania braziliensis MHOM/BR/75/M2904]SYZ64017.1 hypothetical_protein [Leishmania braziliensis MHOM/BR/75/M2904]SYZ64018.1 hypothetical_prote
MGLFGKDRVGIFKPTDHTGRNFTWTIYNFSSHASGTVLDSENVICFRNVKFHLHLSLSKAGDIGFYIHFKDPPVPKYSYLFMNVQEEIMRQQTAHTIPENSERCGHWNVCSLNDMKEFLGKDDTLVVVFTFDNDKLTVDKESDENKVTVLWKIPKLCKQYLCPYSSRGFYLSNSLIVVRLDTKCKSSNARAKYNHKDVFAYIIFLFCRKSTIPPHTIELVDADGDPYYTLEKNDGESAPMPLVERHVVDENLSQNGALFVRITFATTTNPLELLNAHNDAGNNDMDEQHDGSNDETVELGEKKEVYNLMEN